MRVALAAGLALGCNLRRHAGAASTQDTFSQVMVGSKIGVRSTRLAVTRSVRGVMTPRREPGLVVSILIVKPRPDRRSDQQRQPDNISNPR